MNRRSRQTLAASIYGVLSEDGILPSTLPACLRCFMLASCIKIRQLTPREVKVATRTTAAALGGGLSSSIHLCQPTTGELLSLSEPS